MSTNGRNPAATSRQRWVLALTSIGSLMVALDVLVVTTALSTIRLDLHASVEALEWTVNAYSLSFAVLLMTGAALGDRFGRGRMFVVGLGLFTAASAACALAGSIEWLVAARAVQGAGAALVMPLALTLLSAAFPAERRGRALGIFSGVTGLAVLGGPLIGGAVTQGIAWQWIFWLNVPIGLLVIPLVRGRIEETFGPNTSIDLGGLALVSGAALGVVWGLVRGNSAGWGSGEVVAALAGGVLLSAGFVAWERRAAAPMLPMRLFRSRSFSAGNASVFFLSASLYGAVFFMAQLLQTGLGYGPFATGLRLLPWTALLFAVAPIAGALVDRVGERPFVAGGLVLQADPDAALSPGPPEVAWLQPIPDALLAGPGDPAAIVASRGSIRLAFVAALQHLPARQRAVLLLRDVLAWRAAEVAELLGTTTTAINSALRRARAQLAEAAPAEDQVAEPAEAAQRAVLDRYVAAFENGDLTALLDLLRDDIVIEMPPFPAWYSGREAVGRFLAPRVLAAPDRKRYVTTSANGAPAAGLYLRDQDGVYRPHSLQVLTVTTTGIAHAVAFIDAALFATFGLPPAYDAAAAPAAARR